MISTDYRPKQFSDVLGQDTPVAVLKHLAKSEGIAARSILIKGAWGSGKTTVARIFGKAVNCERFAELNDVCNECEGCKQAERVNSRHYIEYDATRVGSVEAIRQMDSVFSSHVKGRRVLVYDEIHTASRQAQSALLKILEEGVPNTFMVFCTTDEVIDTIKSRSCVLEVGLIPHAIIKEQVRIISVERGISLTENQLDTLSIKSNGHMRDALQILELFEMVGEEALRSPLQLLRKFMYLSLKNESIEDILSEIMKYTSGAIRDSSAVMVKNLFLSSEKLETTIRQKGLAVKIFEMFYTPVAQQALNSEVGVEILLRAVNERFQRS